MRITVEISLYPLTEDYLPPITDFIDRLKSYKELEVITNAASTLIVGEHSFVFDVLKQESAVTFASGKNIFVMKVLGFERDIKHLYKM